MSDPLRRFQGELESARHLFRPRLEHFDFVNAIKGVVDFNGRELLRVKRQHLLGRELGRIKFPLPLAIRIAAGANVKRHEVITNEKSRALNSAPYRLKIKISLSNKSRT